MTNASGGLGSGSDNVLWRNTTSGLLTVWTMDGASVTSSQPVTLAGALQEPDATWSIVGIGDYTGAGSDDILWRNTAGTLVLWTLDGAAVTSSQILGYQGGAIAASNTWNMKT